MNEKLLNTSAGPLSELVRRIAIVAVFGIAFAYIESAVVVYLRAIFYPGGFAFPVTDFGESPLWKKLLLVEIGREAATLVLAFSAGWLFGANRRQRFSYFLMIFAVWDIFYYFWLKVILGWPASIMDFDILFLIPAAWASPVLAPVLVSIFMFVIAVVVLYRDWNGKMVKVTPGQWVGFIFAGSVIVSSFCIAGLRMAEPDFVSYFSWPLFLFGLLLAVGLFSKCVVPSN